jgi:hypothetical protein
MRVTTVSLEDLTKRETPFATLEEAFGESFSRDPACEGPTSKIPRSARDVVIILFIPGPASCREEPNTLTNAAAHYDVGWSHGKEALKDGQYDTMKGSYYVDRQSFYLENPIVPEPGKLAAEALVRISGLQSI